MELNVTSPNKSSNDCQLEFGNDYCEPVEDYVDRIEIFLAPKPYEIVIIVLYIAVFAVGIIGNLLVCVSVFRNEYMRTVTNMFLVNLAVADFLVILFCLPLTLLEDVRETWYFGLATCKVVKYLQHCSITVSVLTLTCISLERWFAICFFFKFKATMRRAIFSLVCVWIIGLLVGILQPIMYSTERFTKLPPSIPLLTACKPMWHTQVTMRIRYFEFTLLFVLPFIWMTFAYSMISLNLWTARVPGAQASGSRVTSKRSVMDNTLRGRKRAALMLIAVVVMFFICYLPIHVITFVKTASDSKTDSTTVGITLRAIAIYSHWLCYFNSAINPVIYNFMSAKFRREFKKAFTCGRSSRQRWTQSCSYSQPFFNPRSRVNHNTENLTLTEFRKDSAFSRYNCPSPMGYGGNKELKNNSGNNSVYIQPCSPSQHQLVAH